METIAVINQKGGVGKTTTATNLAAELALAGKHTLIIDVDPQGAVASSFGIDPETLKRTIYDVLVGKYRLNRVIIPTEIENLFLAPANLELSQAEVSLAGEIGRETILRQKLKDVDYEYIIIDTPPSLGFYTHNSLVASNKLIAPLKPEFLPLLGTKFLIQTIRNVEERFTHDLDWKILLTKIDRRRTTTTNILNGAGERFGTHLFKTTIPTNAPLSDAQGHGKPICLYDPSCPGAIAYKQLSEEVLAW